MLNGSNNVQSLAQSFIAQLDRRNTHFKEFNNEWKMAESAIDELGKLCQKA